MGLKQKRKIKKRTISGKGFCKCQNRKYVHGKGIMDAIKNIAAPAMNFINNNVDTLKSGAEAIEML
jgi:hypothetical protein